MMLNYSDEWLQSIMLSSKEVLLDDTAILQMSSQSFIGKTTQVNLLMCLEMVGMMNAM